MIDLQWTKDERAMISAAVVSSLARSGPAATPAWNRGQSPFIGEHLEEVNSRETWERLQRMR